MWPKIAAMAGVLAGCVIGMAAMKGASAADHRDAPALLTENGGDKSLDINDVYVFQSPANHKHTVLIMTVNPLTIPGEHPEFSSTGAYHFNVDTDGDAVEDLRFKFQFQPSRHGKQHFTVTQTRHQPIVLTRTAETGRNKILPGGLKVTAGLFDDPFFFDLDAFKGMDHASGAEREFNDGSENNFFEGFNVTAIVLEVPNTIFRSQHI
ncbi:MAG TPA: DUF4331 family protein, partial [Planctomycetaceae bacterium]|nr:DUF4331 family protein [Planctomycetaceae bacterium]